MTKQNDIVVDRNSDLITVFNNSGSKTSISKIVTIQAVHTFIYLYNKSYEIKE